MPRNAEATVRELLARLAELEARKPRPEEAPILAVARAAILDELSRLARDEGLQVRRRGGSLEAVSLVG